MSFTYEYPRPAVATEAIVFREINGEKCLLLIERKFDPYANCWAFPGGFLDMDETLETCAKRELHEETGLNATSVEQLQAFSRVDRDPRHRVISVAFIVTVDDSEVAVAGDDAKNTKWFPVDELPPLAFDHDEMIAIALKRTGSSANA